MHVFVSPWSVKAAYILLSKLQRKQIFRLKYSRQTGKDWCCSLNSQWCSFQKLLELALRTLSIPYEGWRNLGCLCTTGLGNGPQLSLHKTHHPSLSYASATCFRREPSHAGRKHTAVVQPRPQPEDKKTKECCRVYLLEILAIFKLQFIAITIYCSYLNTQMPPISNIFPILPLITR